MKGKLNPRVIGSVVLAQRKIAITPSMIAPAQKPTTKKKVFYAPNLSANIPIKYVKRTAETVEIIMK